MLLIMLKSQFLQEIIVMPYVKFILLDRVLQIYAHITCYSCVIPFGTVVVTTKYVHMLCIARYHSSFGVCFALSVLASVIVTVQVLVLNSRVFELFKFTFGHTLLVLKVETFMSITSGA